MAPAPSYPLLPFSQLVYEMTRWWSKVYIYRMELRVPQKGSEIRRWQEAIQMAILNHPVFSSRVDWQGRQYIGKNRNILTGKYHQIILQVKGEDLWIKGQISRILGDGTSLAVFIDDIRRAYNGETLSEDDYWGYLEYIEQQKQSQHYRDSSDWLIKEFADSSIPVQPTLDHQWTILPPRVGVCTQDYTDMRKDIYQFCKEQVLTLEGYFSLCVSMAIAEYCGTNSAALTWAYKGRERPEEQRVFGSLHRDIPFKINRISITENQKSDLICQARYQIRSGIAHSDYPYTLTAPYKKRWNYAVNVLRVDDESELIKILPQPVELIPSRQKYAFALLDIEIHESADHLILSYRYSATHYKSESIKKFIALVKKYTLWLLSD